MVTFGALQKKYIYIYILDQQIWRKNIWHIYLDGVAPNRFLRGMSLPLTNVIDRQYKACPFKKKYPDSLGYQGVGTRI